MASIVQAMGFRSKLVPLGLGPLSLVAGLLYSIGGLRPWLAVAVADQVHASLRPQLRSA